MLSLFDAIAHQLSETTFVAPLKHLFNKYNIGSSEPWGEVWVCRVWAGHRSANSNELTVSIAALGLNGYVAFISTQFFM